jgi:hypothetical protein
MNQMEIDSILNGTDAAYFIDPQWAVDQATQLLGQFLPRGEGQIKQIVDNAIAIRGTVGFLSILSLPWSSRAGRRRKSSTPT